MIDFSGAQLDKLAKILEYGYGVERDTTKTSEERILIVLETNAGIQDVDPGTTFADRILKAEAIINNYPDDGGDDGGGSPK